MKVCIVSDSHDNRFLLAAAVKEAKELGAESVLHCGDVVAPTTLKILNPIGLPVHVIHGNNTGDMFSLSRLSHHADSVVQYYGQDAGIELAGKKIFMVHCAHYAEAMATTGDWDIVCCGHDHKASVRDIKNIKASTTLYVNPGTVGGIGHAPTYIMADLEKMEFEIREVPVDDKLQINKTPVSKHS